MYLIPEESSGQLFQNASYTTSAHANISTYVSIMQNANERITGEKNQKL